MALFQLDPHSIAARVRLSDPPTVLPTLAESIWRGVWGFTLVSVAGFSPWPIFETWFRHLREMHLYLACTVIFIGLSGICLHRLILGAGSLPRFYKLFSVAFLAYAVVWVGLWMVLRGTAGSLGGLLGGTIAMGVILSWAFDAWRALGKVVAALFICNLLGYYVGGRIGGKLNIDHRLAAMLLWGVCYGVGFGAGLGAAFHFCQENARAEIKAGTPGFR